MSDHAVGFVPDAVSPRALGLAPLGAQAADLVVWWEKGFYPQEDEAVVEIIAAFEQKTGKQVELVQYAQQDEMSASSRRRSRRASRPTSSSAPSTAPDAGPHVGLTRTGWSTSRASSAQSSDLFDADAIGVSTLLNGKTGRRGLYALPMGRYSNHIHVWNSLLERAGFTLADIPKEWEAFWSFWCDQVQPAVRKVMGRDDIWGVGLPMSAAAIDTDDELLQFELAYGTPWLDRDRRLQVDDPAVRAGIIRAVEAYTAIWRKGCTPPDSTSWTNVDNNKAFLAQTVVMTANTTLSIPGALRTARPDDYYKNAATIDWPDGANGEPLVIVGAISARRGLQGRREPGARRGVRPLPRRGRLACPLAGLRRRPLDAADAQAGRAAVLARPERPATACARRSRT